MGRENNFLLDISDDCCCYILTAVAVAAATATDEQFNKTIKTDKKLSIIHFLTVEACMQISTILRNTYAQPCNILEYQKLELGGYELNYINRESKTGGLVAVYVDKMWTMLYD